MRRKTILNPRAIKTTAIILLLFISVFVSPRDRVHSTAYAGDKGYTRIVVLSDPHLPGRNLNAKQKALDTINSWTDVDMVVVLGDLTEKIGAAEEYAAAKKFFSQLGWPLCPIVGNHDYIYYQAAGKKFTKAPADSRKEKLQTFKETFSIPEVYYTKQVGGYFLVFLSPDDLFSEHLAQISEKQLDWLRSELGKNKSKPTIVFFHAPLRGTLEGNNHPGESGNFIAQPDGKIYALLKDNPQVFLWVSGHTHTAPVHESFSRPPLYDGRVTNIHNPDMDGRSFLAAKDTKTAHHDTVWSNSLYLYPDRVAVRTYDHKEGHWLENLKMEIPSPSGVSKP